ncbi:pentapeptide repeat-containing protein [Bifidobacterium saguinibicoloris]|nr:pentapeptide repeat-containing protein [Bifidobacterium saguinibicoloris]
MLSGCRRVSGDERCCVLSGCVLSGCVLSGCVLSGCVLSDTRLPVL